MSLSKTRIIGFALGIILLACLMEKELYGYDGKLFHEKIVDLTIEMMISRYPNLPKESLKKGSTGPDKDREDFQKNPLNIPLIPKDNEEHKRDTTRINRNYGDAIKRYKHHVGRDNRKEGLNQGARILAKSFHYVSDQTEPEESRGLRGVIQDKLQKIMANDEDKKNFFDKVSRLCQEYQFNPRDDKFIEKEITKIRTDFEKATKDKAKNEIDGNILDYLAKIVAIQNLMLEQFVKETGAFQPPDIQTKSPSSLHKTETPYDIHTKSPSSLHKTETPYDIQTKSPSSLHKTETPHKTKSPSPPVTKKDVNVGDERCRQIDSALAEASKANDIKQFRALVEQARAENCDFYQNANNHLRNWEQQQQEGRCKHIDSALAEASKAKNINRFRALVELAKAENCDFYQNAYNHLRNLEQQQQEGHCKQIDSALAEASKAKDINRFRALVEQARAENCDFYQNAYNHLRNLEQQQQEGHCKQIDSALAAASKAKNINRFRALVEQARVDNCGCYQTAYNHLRNWEQQLQRSTIQPPPRPPIKPQPQPPPQPPKQTRPPTPTKPPRCQKVCVQEEVVWHNVTDGRHSLCAGGKARPPGPGLPPPKCERSVKCIKWETRCQ